MKENVKNTTKTLYTMCICLVIVMGVLFLGNSLTKGTYSAAVTPELDPPLATATEYCSNGATPSNGKCGCETGYILQEDFGICCPKGSTWARDSGMCIITGQWSAAYEKPGIGAYNCASYDKTVCEKKGLTYTNGKCIWKCGEPSKQQIASKTCAAGMYLINNKCIDSTSSLPSCSSVLKGKCGDATVFSSIKNGYICNDGSKYNSGILVGTCEDIDGTTYDYYKYIKQSTSSDSSKTYKVTFKNTDDSTIYERSCDVPAGSTSCTVNANGTVPKNSDSSSKNQYFRGWGSKGCTSSDYQANASFTISKNTVYYACYDSAGLSGSEDSDWSKDNCTYSAESTVTRDEEHLNCKYINISYRNSPNGFTFGNIQACCNKYGNGYTFISKNFTSSGAGYEYCIKCSSSGGGGGSITPDPTPDPTPTPTSKPSTSTPTNPPTSTPSSNVDENPKTGSIAIFMVWVIAIGTLIYSIAYFKQSKFE